jgi:hypothetical protein
MTDYEADVADPWIGQSLGLFCHLTETLQEFVAWPGLEMLHLKLDKEK